MITCRVLSSDEMSIYGEFLKERTEQSLRMYFGGGVSEFYIDTLIQKIVDNPKEHRIVVAENDMNQVVGTIHVAFMNTKAVEFGVMVAEEHRKLGISSKMMDFALTWCRNRDLNDIYMHCLGYNEPIIHLVKKHGLEVTKEYGDADAHVTLPHSNLFSFQHEAMIRQSNYMANNVRTFRKLLAV
jgi:RimJ/RimL family protein N-acetyltransferase